MSFADMIKNAAMSLKKTGTVQVPDTAKPPQNNNNNNREEEKSNPNLHRRDSHVKYICVPYFNFRWIP